MWQKSDSLHQSTSLHVATPVNLSHHDEQLCLIDIGTGSGAIAITAKLEYPDATVFATDIDNNCLGIAKRNATRLHADVEFRRGNLMEAFRKSDSAKLENKVIILLCNLPYVPENFQINTAATHEPHHALFGGQDGLDVYRDLFKQLVTQDVKPHYILTESLPHQHTTLLEIATAAGYRFLHMHDFIQAFELIETVTL